MVWPISPLRSFAAKDAILPHTTTIAAPNSRSGTAKSYPRSAITSRRLRNKHLPADTIVVYLNQSVAQMDRASVFARFSHATRVAAAGLLLVVVSTGCSSSGVSYEARLLSKAHELAGSNPTKALAMARKSAELGHIPAMLSLGSYETTGRLNGGFTRDTPSRELRRTNEWYKRARVAALNDHSPAGYSLAAWLVRLGVGGDHDIYQSNELAFQAARLGDDRTLLMNTFFATSAGDNEMAQEMLDRARSEGLLVAYHIEAYLQSLAHPDDVVAYATPLAIAEAQHEERAAIKLQKLAYDLSVAAKQGDAVAARSIKSLKDNELWREPTQDFFPRNYDSWM